MIVKELIEVLRSASPDDLVVVATESWPVQKNMEFKHLESVEVGESNCIVNQYDFTIAVGPRWTLDEPESSQPCIILWPPN